MRLPLQYRYLAVSAVLLAFVGFSWVHFLMEFSRVGTTEDRAVPVAAASADNSTDAGFMAWFQQSGPPRSRDIAEQNIFSPLRREWVSPQARQESVQSEAGVAGFAPAGKPRDDIELRGIIVVGGERRAILRFLASKPERVISLAEGESTDKDGDSAGEVFTLARIESEYALIRDEGGTLYQIGLFDHRRVAQPVKAPEVKIIITPLPPAPGPSPVISPEPERADQNPAAPRQRPAARNPAAKG